MSDCDVKLEIELKHCSNINDISFSPNGKFLVVGTKEDFVDVWDWQNRAQIGYVQGISKANSYTTNTHTVWSPDSQFFAVALKKTCIVYNTKLQIVITQAL